jgi:hypothetical protein
MNKTDALFTQRKSLDEICQIPDKIISVYSLEQHVWAESNSEAARHKRRPELKTIEEFQIDPVRPFLTDIFRKVAAPYKPEQKENPIGQGYWIQAEFGSGKSHLLCTLAALTLGSEKAWDLVREKEKKEGRGKRDSLYRFWEEGIAAKSSNGKKGIFVIVKTLVGAGGGVIGVDTQGRRLTEYIIDAAKEQIQIELGKNLSLYPAELLADRFVTDDLERYRQDLKKFLKDPNYFNEDEFEELNDFIREIRQDKNPEYKKSCGNKLWRFYTEFLRVQPQIAAETEEILKHLVETILAEGYSGILLVLDEMSLFMKNRNDNQRADDEKTLVVLSNRLAKVHNLPVWTVCTAQQAIQSKMGAMNIIADDRLKLVKLLEEDEDYYQIVLSRVREVLLPDAISNYYLYYKKGFSWPATIGEQEFRRFFPFHKPALEVLRAITFELTTTRSAIHFMHQTLKRLIKQKGSELIRLWELFDETVRYEEDPSGTHAGLVAIKTKKEDDYRAYESCKRQIDGLTKGYLKVHRDKAVKLVQTLFLYHIAKTRQEGISAEEIANSVLIQRDTEANIEENIQHYETLSENLKKELRQIVQTYDDDKMPRYRFDPVYSGIDPRVEFQKARDKAEGHQVMLQEAWNHLLALGEWPVRTRQMTIDISAGVRSIFKSVAPTTGSGGTYQNLEVIWNGRQIYGTVAMHDLARIVRDHHPLPAINSSDTGLDFALFISTRTIDDKTGQSLLERLRDPRVILWIPAERTVEEQESITRFAAYRFLVSEWQGKESEDAVTIIHWVTNALQGEMGKIAKAVTGAFGRGKMVTSQHSNLKFHMAGELASILTPVIDRVLSSVYVSKDIQFEPPIVFRKEEAVKVINGIVKTGGIPKHAKPNQNINAAQNFGFGLKIIQKADEKKLDLSECPYAADMWQFIDDKLVDEGHPMKTEALYKNFMGIGGPKDYGLTQRMVQLYLLCLVRTGKVRLTVSPKAGLPFTLIDYANIDAIDFSAKILDALTGLQKVTKPQNWDVLRPYAEKLLEEDIPDVLDDSAVSQFRARLKSLFVSGKENAARIRQKAETLFAMLKADVPYAQELAQMQELFAMEVENGDEINLILHALKQALEYKAFDTNRSDANEVDDLANRLKNYRDMDRFLAYEGDLRTAYAYCANPFPDLADLKTVRTIQAKLCAKLSDLKPFIDSEVRLKTELVGSSTPGGIDRFTLNHLIAEYTTVYHVLHDQVLERVDEAREGIRAVMEGEDFRALQLMEGITALAPAVSREIEKTLDALDESLFECPAPARSDVAAHLKRGPLHECGLSFDNAALHLQAAEDTLEKAEALLENAVSTKIAVLMTPAVRHRLEQGINEKQIADLLACRTEDIFRSTLKRMLLEDADLVDLINRFLKKIVIRKVHLSDFKPGCGPVEPDQIPIVVKEFQAFLEKSMHEAAGGDPDVLPVLQIE